MKKICLLIAVTFVAVSCLNDFERKGPDPSSASNIPNDFNWETTTDVGITVAAPVVAGGPETANIRIYLSPLLYDRYLIAKGVAAAGGRFRTSVSIPAEVTDLYIKTTLPDGTSTVQSVPVAKTVTVPGAIILKTATASKSAKMLATRAKQPSGFDELEIPVVEPKTPASFDAQAVISRIESGKNYQLGGKKPYYVAENYLIPAGAVIEGGIQLDGDYTGSRRTLYVAGKLTLSVAVAGRVTLAVLKGGVVEIGSMSVGAANNSLGIYVFEGGSFKANTINLSGKMMLVNKGHFEVTSTLDANSGSMVYNYTDATMKLEEAELSNSTEFHNDGVLEINDAQGNSNAMFCNWENGVSTIGEFCCANSSVEVWQRGVAHFGDFEMNGGKLYFQCYTTIGEFYGDNGDIELAGGVGLEVEKVDFNSNVKMSLASGSLFTISEQFKTGGANFTSEAKKKSDQIAAVILITGEADCALWGTSFKGGPLEVVSTELLDKKLFSQGSGAYQSPVQTVVIPATVCNGSKTPVEPEPDPLPENDYSMQKGTVNTYCFEDNWPWLGDYDMNDVVIEVRVDHEQSKDGSLVKSIVINWSLKAAGGQHHTGCALQMDRVAASKIANVTSTYRMGPGFFDNGLEAGNDLAVIPFFNLTSDLLNKWNTFKEDKHAHADPSIHMTRITFNDPIDIDDVVESAMNIFVVVGERAREVHLTGHGMTNLGRVNGGNCLPSSPYKFYSDLSEQTRNNNMMWALKIPGIFRYPAEMKDIRRAYTYFSAWAQSNGTAHKEWYSEEAGSDENLIY